MSDAIRSAARCKTDVPRQAVFAEMQKHFHAAHIGRSLPRLSLTDKGMDAALGGGFLCRRVHLVTGKQASLTSGFSLALVAMMLRAKKAQGPILWCGPLRGGQSGQLFGAGLAALGLRAEQFIFVRDSHPLRRMAACEEALATPGLSAVIHEYGPLYEKADLWQKSARRLQLACENGTATAFMIGQAGSPCGFESGWNIQPALESHRAPSDWRPMWHAQLHHVRGGYPAAGNLIWNREEARFIAGQRQDWQIKKPAIDKPLWEAQPYRADKHAPRWQRSA